jgi:predicted ATPase
MSQPNNWYVITGGPSTGKTSLIDELQKRGYKTIPEAARKVIDEAMAKGISMAELRADESRFQDDIVRFKATVESSQDPNELTFLDRGMQDSLAYLRYYGFPEESWHMDLMNSARYRKVFLLEPLPTFEQDYARIEDEDFTKRIHGLFLEAYTQYGMKPVVLPPVSIDDRVTIILSHVHKGQPS